MERRTTEVRLSRGASAGLFRLWCIYAEQADCLAAHLHPSIFILLPPSGEIVGGHVLEFEHNPAV